MPNHDVRRTDRPTDQSKNPPHPKPNTPPTPHSKNTGKAIAEAIRGEIKDEVEALKAAKGVTPGLAVVLVGNRTDSATYVRMKIKACEEVGLGVGGCDWWLLGGGGVGRRVRLSLFRDSYVY